jgi:hypothetical protein
MATEFYASIQTDDEYRDYGPHPTLEALQAEIGKEIDNGELFLCEYTDEVRVTEIDSVTRKSTSYNMIQSDIPVSETETVDPVLEEGRKCKMTVTDIENPA